jgi:hypothetical protein
MKEEILKGLSIEELEERAEFAAAPMEEQFLGIEDCLCSCSCTF